MANDSNGQSGNGGTGFLFWALGALLLIGGGAVVYSMTRGLRNNNPGNIVYDGTAWEGLANPPSDGHFCVFTDATYGIRAMTHVLTSYFNRGLNTVTEIISTWAPSTENDTGSYINAVSGSMGVDPNATVNLNDPNAMLALISAIITQENGLNPYDAGTIQTGMALA